MAKPTAPVLPFLRSRSNIDRMIIVGLFWAASIYFGWLCRSLSTGTYFNSSKTALVALLLQTVLSIILMMLTSSFVAALIRPLKWTLAAFGVGGVILLAFLGFSKSTLYLGALYVVFYCVYALVVVDKQENQVKWSIAPLVDGMKYLLVLFGIIVSASFAPAFIPYAADHTSLASFMNGLHSVYLQLLSKMRNTTVLTFAGFIGVIFFFLFEGVLLVVSLVPLLLLELSSFWILRKAHIAGYSTEEHEVQHIVIK